MSTDLKATLDDHLPVFLSSANTPSQQPLPRNLRFTPSHFLTYVRLAFGYSAVVIAAYIFYLDYILKKDFADTKQLTLYAVIAYFILNGALTGWIWFVEKGIVFTGERGDELLLKLRSLPAHKKYDPVYRLIATWNAKAKASETREISAPFPKFFSEDGYFVAQEFEGWLKTELPMLTGEVESKKTS